MLKSVIIFIIYLRNTCVILYSYSILYSFLKFIMGLLLKNIKSINQNANRWSSVVNESNAIMTRRRGVPLPSPSAVAACASVCCPPILDVHSLARTLPAARPALILHLNCTTSFRPLCQWRFLRFRIQGVKNETLLGTAEYHNNDHGLMMMMDSAVRLSVNSPLTDGTS